VISLALRGGCRLGRTRFPTPRRAATGTTHTTAVRRRVCRSAESSWRDVGHCPRRSGMSPHETIEDRETSPTIPSAFHPSSIRTAVSRRSPFQAHSDGGR
jgi:hypothetical protein